MRCTTLSWAPMRTGSRRALAGTRATHTTASACHKSWPNHSPPDLIYADRTLITGVKNHTCFRITMDLRYRLRFGQSRITARYPGWPTLEGNHRHPMNDCSPIRYRSRAALTEPLSRPLPQYLGTALYFDACLEYFCDPRGDAGLARRTLRPIARPAQLAQVSRPISTQTRPVALWSRRSRRDT